MEIARGPTAYRVSNSPGISRRRPLPRGVPLEKEGQISSAIVSSVQSKITQDLMAKCLLRRKDGSSRRNRKSSLAAGEKNLLTTVLSCKTSFAETAAVGREPLTKRGNANKSRRQKEEKN
ncbi:hypothetical protein E2320_012697 [Naja naja]|nr:hypothetical protein E2320_012697 [Naja naja]